jgi:hypothetical protein
LLNLWQQGSGFDRLVPHNQRAARPHPDHKTAGSLDAFDGASKRGLGEGEGAGHGAIRLRGAAYIAKVKVDHRKLLFWL